MVEPFECPQKFVIMGIYNGYNGTGCALARIFRIFRGKDNY